MGDSQHPVSIHVEGIGKRYRLGGQGAYGTLRDAITAAARSSLNAVTRQLGPSRGARAAGPIPHEEFWALRDVTFEIGRGEAVGVIGRNGAGKSTLLKILCRITSPTSGLAVLRGRVGSLLEVGTGFHQELTGRENVYLSGAILGMRREEIRRKFDEIVAFAEVERFIDTPVKHYSSGMYLRLAFAVAAHLEPEILVVDEVLAVGDAVFQKRCLGRMSEVAGQGRTVLFVSHNMAAVSSLTSRCLLLRDGTLAADGPTAAVVGEYLRDPAAPEGRGVVDLRSLQERRGGGQVADMQLVRLTILGTDGQPSGVIPEGCPFDVRLDFEVRRPVAQFSVGCTFSTQAGVRVFSVLSGKQGWDGSRGTYSVSARIEPNVLRPGLYNLSLGLESSLWQDGGYDVAAVEIVVNPQLADAPYPPTGDFGVIALPIRWSAPAPAAAPG